MCAWTCRNMHRRAHTWKKVASNGSDICIQPALVIFHPIWFMHIFQLWLPPPPAAATPLPCLPQVCLVRCLGPLCVRMLMTAIYLAGFTAATIKNLWFLRWPVFTCYTASYIAYIYHVHINLLYLQNQLQIGSLKWSILIWNLLTFHVQNCFLEIL